MGTIADLIGTTEGNILPALFERIPKYRLRSLVLGYPLAAARVGGVNRGQVAPWQEHPTASRPRAAFLDELNGLEAALSKR